MIPYEITEHTAEIGVRAYGRTREELFAHMAQGMMSLMVPPAQIKPAVTYSVKASAANDEERLLVAWLKELLYLFAVKKLIGKEFKIRRLTAGCVEAEVSGEKLDLARHEVDKEVKAVTYCELSLTRGADGLWSAQVIFDI